MVKQNLLRMAITASIAAMLALTTSSPVSAAQTPAPIALAGEVRSNEEGPMEGVLVSAKKTVRRSR